MFQQWQSLANGRILDFEAMAIDLRRCAGVPISQAKQALIDSKLGDIYLDCVRIL